MLQAAVRRQLHGSYGLLHQAWELKGRDVGYGRLPLQADIS